MRRFWARLEHVDTDLMSNLSRRCLCDGYMKSNYKVQHAERGEIKHAVDAYATRKSTAKREPNVFGGYHNI